VSLPRIRLERCEPSGGGLWRLDPGQERHLLKVLRCYEGAMLEGLLPENGGGRLLMRLEKMGSERFVRVVETMEPGRNGARVTLLIGLLKADQFDSVLRASSELGVSEIWPILCARSVPRLDVPETQKKNVSLAQNPRRGLEGLGLRVRY
jgi:16S rRNA (uracil1498-N3)-methyltransferase